MVKLISCKNSLNNEFILYCDFDFDGTSETVRIIPKLYNKASLVFVKNDGIIGQWSFNGELISTLFYHDDDYDFNGQREMYLLTYRHDSLFVQIIEPCSGKIIARDFFVTTFDRYLGELDFHVGGIESADLNHDGLNELIIALHCGYSVTTRKIISIDIRSGQKKVSPVSGLGVTENLILFDIDTDSKPEFFGKFGVYGNCKAISAAYPMSDTSGWLIVYKSDLDYLFPPFIVGRKPAVMTTTPFMTGSNGQIAWNYEYLGTSDDTSYIALSDNKGHIIRKIQEETTSSYGNSFFTSFPGDKRSNLALYNKEGFVRIYNKDLKLTKQLSGYPDFTYFMESRDLNLDGKNEYIFRDNNQSIIILTENMDHPAVHDLIPEITINIISILLTPGRNPQFSLSTVQQDYIFEYLENPVYRTRYLIMAGAFMMIFGCFLALGWLFQISAEHRFEVEKKINRLQIAALENQLNPHFILNILNSIGALYERNNTEKARYYFGKYAKLLRNTLTRSGEISILLKDELEFVKNYLELEKLRTDNSFDYQITIPETIPDIEVPKMLVHTFTENAVKHGIRHSLRQGELIIAAGSTGKQVKISISDNGIGRAKAGEYSSMSTGRGLKILDETLKLYYQLKQIRIDYKMTDLYNENGEPAGTRADIFIPIS